MGKRSKSKYMKIVNSSPLAEERRSYTVRNKEDLFCFIPLSKSSFDDSNLYQSCFYSVPKGRQNENEYKHNYSHIIKNLNKKIQKAR